MSVPQTLCVSTRSSLSLKVSPGRRQFGGDGALDGRDAQVAAFDGGAAPVNAGGFEAAAGGGDGVLDGRGVMLQAGGQGLLVAEDQQRLGRRLRAPLVKGLGQQAGKGVGLRLERGGQLGELARLGPGRGLERGEDRLAEFGSPWPVLATSGSTGTPSSPASLPASMWCPFSSATSIMFSAISVG